MDSLSLLQGIIPTQESNWGLLHFRWILYQLSYQETLIMLKILQADFSNMRTVNFQMFRLVLEKAEEPEVKLPTSTESSNKQENSRKNIPLL